jgi:hypothetical protein
MHILPTSKESLVLIRRVVAFGAGLSVWLFCGHLNGRASAQTGMIVPVDIQVCRDIVRWLWFPFSWLPEPRYINDIWSILKGLLIGVPYAVIVGLVILWLFRTSQPKRYD